MIGTRRVEGDTSHGTVVGLCLRLTGSNVLGGHNPITEIKNLPSVQYHRMCSVFQNKQRVFVYLLTSTIW